jgi:hypothetical protein
VREDKLPTSIPFKSAQDLAELPDGRVAIIGSSIVGYYSNTVLTLSNDGRFSPIIHLTDDVITNPLFSTYAAPQIISVGGDLLATGSAYYSSYQQKLIKIDAGTATDQPDQFAGGTNNDVVVDSKGGVHMAYYDANTAHLMYVFRDAAGIWSAPRTIDGHPKTGQYISIAVDSANQPAIAYYDGTTADLKFAQYSNKKKKWGLTTLDTKGTTGQYPSLAFSSASVPAIAYYSKTGGDLKFVTTKTANGSTSRSM